MTEPGSEGFLGVDGGATRTRFLLTNAAGEVLARSEAGGSLLGVGEDEAIAVRIGEEARGLAGAAGLELPLVALCAGLAGAAGRPRARAECAAKLEALAVADRVTLASDAEVAFEDAFGGGDGILLIAGSGSIGLARSLAETGDPALRRVGGWGVLLGDEGSGYGIGLAGLRAAVAGSEGRAPETSLLAALYEVLDLDSVRALFEWTEAADKPAIAALAPAVIEVAREADQVAARIVDETIQGLVAHARALRGKYFFTSPPPSVALVGGLVQDGGPLRSQLRRALEAEAFEVVAAPVVPVRGAARMARRLAVGEVS